MKHARNLAMSGAILWSHRLRTSLSVVGITVGVASMIAIVSIGNGAREDVLDTFRSMGTDMLVVRAGKFREHRGRPRQMAEVTTLTLKDAIALSTCDPAITDYAPAISRRVQVRLPNVATQTRVEAITPLGLSIRNVEAAQGRLYLDREGGARRNVAVLGATVAKNLFRQADPVGQYVTVGRLPFLVVGVAQAKGADMNGDDQDNIVFIPLETGMHRLFHVTYIEAVYLKVQGETNQERAAAAATELMRHRHKIKPGQEDDFTVQNQLAFLETALETADSTNRLVAGVAAISLVVAGIGILAVMLMSVRERRWEIGLRRAVGATRIDILMQFLAEAALLSMSGAVLGLIVGVATVVASNHFGWARAEFSIYAAALSSALSIGVGLVFGIYPARKASLMEPIAALSARE